MKYTILTCSLFFFFCTASLLAQNWTQAVGAPASTCFSVTMQNGILYAASEDSIYRSTNNGTTWSPTTAQPVVSGALSAVYAYKSILYAGTAEDGVFRSTDNGTSWIDVSGGLTGWAKHITTLVALGDSIYAATDGDGIYVMDLNNIAAWRSYNTGLFQYGANALYSYDDMLIASLGMYVFSRQRGGAAWSDVSIDSTVTQREAYAFFRYENHLFAGSGAGVHRGSVQLTGWQKVGISLLPNLTVTAFAVYRDSLMVNVLFQDESFICVTTDKGATWNVFAHEFSILYDMEVYDSRIIACRGDGIWYYDFSSPTSAEPIERGVPESFVLHQNFPNPFNPATEFTFEVREGGMVTLAVYDVLGKEIAKPVNESLPPGRYSVPWNAVHIPSGIYMYRLTAGTFTDSKKLVLMK